jgi:hypothetical protein
MLHEYIYITNESPELCELLDSAQRVPSKKAV